MSIPIHALISTEDQISALGHQIERLEDRQAGLRSENERLRHALDGLLMYVSSMEESRQWDSLSTPGAVVTALAALAGARTHTTWLTDPSVGEDVFE